MGLKATAIFKPRDGAGRFVEARVSPAVRMGVGEVTQLIYDLSQSYVAVDTGELKASGKMEITETGKTITGKVEYTAEHGPYVEFGTGGRGMSSPDAGAGPYDPNWPGMAPQPFIRPAHDEARAQAEAIFATHLETAVK